MREWVQRNKWHIYVSTILLFLVFLILPMITRVRVQEDLAYYSKEEVALYILEYDRLPANFITKLVATGVFFTYYSAIDHGFNIGGDVFRYEGEIIRYTDQTDLRECDIYLNREVVVAESDRGSDRLVFSADGNVVFYSHDHYDSFRQLTTGKIQATSTFFWVLFVLYDLCIGGFYYYVFAKKMLVSEDLIKGGKHVGFHLGRTIIAPFMVAWLMGTEGIQWIKSRKKIDKTDPLSKTPKDSSA